MLYVEKRISVSDLVHYYMGITYACSQLSPDPAAEVQAEAEMVFTMIRAFADPDFHGDPSMMARDAPASYETTYRISTEPYDLILKPH